MSEQTLNFLLNLARVEEKSEKILTQVYRNNAVMKTAVNKLHVLLRKEKVSLMKRDQDGQQRAELKKTLQKFINLCMKIVG
jgi:hypothetical protein